MKTIVLILILSMSGMACPQVMRTFYGRITHGSQGVPMMSLSLMGTSTSFSRRTTQLGYYRIEVTGCDTWFIFSGKSKRHYFSMPVVFTNTEQELNIAIP